MKVDLDKLEINISPLTDEVFIGVTDPKHPNVWKHKKNVTSGFLACVIQRWSGYKQQITSSNGKKYELTLKEVTE